VERREIRLADREDLDSLDRPIAFLLSLLARQNRLNDIPSLSVRAYRMTESSFPSLNYAATRTINWKRERPKLRRKRTSPVVAETSQIDP
jgi:hypothetical protein